MKKILLTLIMVATVGILYAQQDTVWRRGGLISVAFSQASLSNWSAGGENSISGNSIFSYFANFKRGKNEWDNTIDLAYGMTMQGKDSRVVKSEDKIDISSKYGHQAGSSHWFYSVLFNFRSQFTDGFNYPNDSDIISKFLAPGYVTLALGMDYKPNDYFSFFVSPATVRFTIVNDKTLSSAEAFGIDSGETIKTEAGAYVKIAFKKDLSTTVNLQTQLDLFSNYLENPQNVDANWQMLLAMKVSKYITASVSAQLIYDDNTKITGYNDDGTISFVGPRTQFKEVIGIGFAYKFAGYTVK